MVSTFAHELVEVMSDPFMDAWYDDNGMENADKCAWSYGKVLTVPGSQKKYNSKAGNKLFLIQQNWDPRRRPGSNAQIGCSSGW